MLNKWSLSLCRCFWFYTLLLLQNLWKSHKRLTLVSLYGWLAGTSLINLLWWVFLCLQGLRTASFTCQSMRCLDMFSQTPTTQHLCNKQTLLSSGLTSWPKWQASKQKWTGTSLISRFIKINLVVAIKLHYWQLMHLVKRTLCLPF